MACEHAHAFRAHVATTTVVAIGPSKRKIKVAVMPKIDGRFVVLGGPFLCAQFCPHPWYETVGNGGSHQRTERISFRRKWGSVALGDIWYVRLLLQLRTRRPQVRVLQGAPPHQQLTAAAALTRRIALDGTLRVHQHSQDETGSSVWECLNNVSPPTTCADRC